MDRANRILISSPRWVLGISLGAFVTFIFALIALDSIVSRMVVGVLGIAVSVVIGWVVVDRQLAAMFELFRRTDESGLPSLPGPGEMPSSARLVAALESRHDRGRLLRDVIEELEETKRQLEVTVEVATDGLCKIHYQPDRFEVGAGRYFASGMDFFGVPSHSLTEVSYQSLLDRFRPEDRDILQLQARAAGESGDFYGFDVRFRNLAGEWRWLSAKGRTMSTEKGLPTEILLVLSDVTRRRELERRAALSDTMRSLGYLVSELSHDLKNSMAVIGVNTDLLLDADLDVAARDRLLLNTRHMTDDALALVNSVLQLAPIPSEVEIVDLNAAVMRVGESLTELAGDGVELEVIGATGEVPAQVDRRRFEQVVLNMGLNAIDAVQDAGRVRLIADTVRIAENHDSALAPGHYFRLVVADDGEGIPDDVIDEIFEPFVTSKAPDLGTGLGLAMSFDTVAAAGGTILADSGRDGGGAAFTVLLPVVSR